MGLVYHSSSNGFSHTRPLTRRCFLPQPTDAGYALAPSAATPPVFRRQYMWCRIWAALLRLILPQHYSQPAQQKCRSHSSAALTLTSILPLTRDMSDPPEGRPANPPRRAYEMRRIQQSMCLARGITGAQSHPARPKAAVTKTKPRDAPWLPAPRCTVGRLRGDSYCRRAFVPKFSAPSRGGEGSGSPSPRCAAAVLNCS